MMNSGLIENRFLAINSAADRLISVKFCIGKQNSITVEVAWHKTATILKVIKWVYLNEKSSDFGRIWYRRAYL